MVVEITFIFTKAHVWPIVVITLIILLDFGIFLYLFTHFHSNIIFKEKTFEVVTIFRKYEIKYEDIIIVRQISRLQNQKTPYIFWKLKRIFYQKDIRRFKTKILKAYYIFL